MLYIAKIDLRYWREVFIYVVHIRSLISISRLKEVILYEIWTRKKLDVSYKQIFKALGWTYVSKKVWKEKLNLKAIKI